MNTKPNITKTLFTFQIDMFATGEQHILEVFKKPSMKEQKFF